MIRPDPTQDFNADSEFEGNAGTNSLDGGPDRDYIDISDEDSTNDRASGGSGDDFINADDGQVDIISCGSGNDIVIFDATLDVVAADCEDQTPVALAAARTSADESDDD